VFFQQSAQNERMTRTSYLFVRSRVSPTKLLDWFTHNLAL